MATVELTGFVMTNTIASGQFLVIKILYNNDDCGGSSDVTHFAQASARFLTIDAFVLKRSSRVIPKKLISVFNNNYRTLKSKF